jgi:hypothetical protein
VFIWLSSSISSASVQLAGGGGPATLNMPPLPSELTLASSGSMPMHDPTPRQVFLTSYCQRTRQPYLMRFARQGNSGRYVALCSHKLEVVEAGDEDFMPPIRASQLDGCPPCPYCNNLVAATCPCGAIFCDRPDNRDPCTCPKCQAQTIYGGSSDFEIQRTSG